MDKWCGQVNRQTWPLTKHILYNPTESSGGVQEERSNWLVYSNIIELTGNNMVEAGKETLKWRKCVTESSMVL